MTLLCYLSLLSNSIALCIRYWRNSTLKTKILDDFPRDWNQYRVLFPLDVNNACGFRISGCCIYIVKRAQSKLYNSKENFQHYYSFQYAFSSIVRNERLYILFNNVYIKNLIIYTFSMKFRTSYSLRKRKMLFSAITISFYLLC